MHTTDQGPTDALRWLYYVERRNVALTGYQATVTPELARYQALHPAAESFARFARLERDEAPARVAIETERSVARGIDLEWRVHDFDLPAQLPQILEACGYAHVEDESVVIADLDRCMRLPLGRLAEDYAIRRLSGASQLGDLLAVQQGVWGRSLPALEYTLASELAGGPSTVVPFCAYQGETPVATVWLRLYRGSSIAEIDGGAVLPPHRGTGLFTHLLAHAFRAAMERRVRHICADATAMSLPILIERGFEAVCRVSYFRRPSVARDYANGARPSPTADVTRRSS